MLAVFVSIACQLAALACLKIASGHSSVGDFSIFSLLANQWLLFAFVFLAFQALAWQLALRKYPLSYIYPFNGLIYPGALALAHMAFNEPVTIFNVVGATLIVGGIWSMKE